MSFGGYQSSNGCQLKSPQYYIPNPKSQFDDQICENQRKRKTDFDGGVSGSTVLGVSNTMPCAVISQPRLTMPIPRNTSKAVYGSPGLSLTLTSGGGESQGEVNVPGISEYERQQQIHQQQGRSRDEDYESRSGSDNLDGASGDEQDADLPPRKKRYHRHTPQQIQELESLFKECPHPDEKQRAELSKRLNLETRQVKFWFQNRRTQMKTQLERHENSILRQENEKLRVENMSIKEAMRNPMCSNCGGPAVLGDMSLEEQQLRIENARLKEELDRLCTLAGKFFGRPVHPSMPMPVVSSQSLMPKSTQDLGVGAVMNPTTTQSMMLSLANSPGSRNPMGLGIEKSMMAELAVAAMDEFIKMAQAEETLWVPSLETAKENLNYEEYLRQFSSNITPKPMGLTTEATRESGVVMIRSLNLVDTLMDAERWKDMFPCIVSRAAVVDVITSGLGGTRNGALQLMYAELQVLSPFVQAREVYFLRFCKQHAEGIWAVVDVSVDSLRDIPHPPTPIKCRRFPSGCLIQEMPNGSCKVTWMEHAEYDDREVHRHYKTLINSGMAFGAQRWLATLQRQCDCIAVLMSAREDPNGIAMEGKRSMLKLAQRMTENFYAGINASSTAHVWKKLSRGSGEDDVRIMTRESMNDPGEPAGMVLSVSTSLWLPVSRHRLFHFLRDERLRSEWDILSNGSPMQEMTHIPKGQDPGNSVSILRASGISGSQNEMVILQETWTDASGSMVVYAPVDILAMQSVLSGGDPAFVEVLPSGFAIVADGPEYRPVHGGAEGGVGGSLMSVAFQIVADTVPTAKPNVQSVETANIIITRTVRRIKAALHCEDA